MKPNRAKMLEAAGQETLGFRVEQMCHVPHTDWQPPDMSAPVGSVEAVRNPATRAFDHDRAADTHPKAMLPRALTQRAGTDSAVFAGLIGRPFEQRERDAEFSERLGHLSLR